MCDLITGEEAWTEHTRTRAEHQPVTLTHEPMRTGSMRCRRLAENKKLCKEIEKLISNNPNDGMPDFIISTLGFKYPELRNHTKDTLRYFLERTRRKYIPNEGKVIMPEKVNTLSGEMLGREYISTDTGDFFTMYSDYAEFFIKKCRGDTTHLMVDGTFKCVPPEYFFMPIFFCFMSTKDRAAYQMVITKVRQLLDKNGLRPNYVTCDFEKALMQELTAVFTETRFIGCFFHFTHCVTTKCRHMSMYRDGKDVATRSMLSELKGLPFIEASLVPPKFAEIKDKYIKHGDLFRQFLKYFETTFIKGAFSIDKWNYFEMIKTLDKDFRTVITNIPVESINKRLNAGLSSMNPTCFDAIQSIKKLENIRRFQFEELLAGKKRSTKHRSLYEHYIKIARERSSQYQYFEYNEEAYNDIDNDEFDAFAQNAYTNGYPRKSDEQCELTESAYERIYIADTNPGVEKKSHDNELRKKYKVGEEQEEQAKLNKRKAKRRVIIPRNKHAWNYWTLLAKIRESLERSKPAGGEGGADGAEARLGKSEAYVAFPGHRRHGVLQEEQWEGRDP